MQRPIITISAPYGAGGPIVGRAVADKVGVPFLDRAIPTTVARALAVSVTDAEAHDERADTRVTRILAALGVAGLGFLPATEPQVPPEAYREETVRVIRTAAETTGCVVLGRAGVVVLRGHPGAFHVCLTGTFEKRVGQATEHDPTGDPRTIHKLIEETDRNRKAYYRYFYNTDPDEPGLYHMVLDSTVLALDDCVDLVLSGLAALQRSSPGS